MIRLDSSRGNGHKGRLWWNCPLLGAEQSRKSLRHFADLVPVGLIGSFGSFHGNIVCFQGGVANILQAVAQFQQSVMTEVFVGEAILVSD